MAAIPHNRHREPHQYERGGYAFTFNVAEAAPDAARSEQQLAHALELLRRACALADGSDVSERAA